MSAEGGPPDARRSLATVALSATGFVGGTDAAEPRPISVVVEAGGSAELYLSIRPGPDAPAGRAAFAIEVLDVPGSWYTLSAKRLEASGTEPTRVLLVLHPPRDDRRGPPGLRDARVRVSSPGDAFAWEGHVTLVVAPPGVVATLRQLRRFLPALYPDDAAPPDSTDLVLVQTYLGPRIVHPDEVDRRAMRSRLLDFLPAVFDDGSDVSHLASRILLLFQSILDPLEHTVDTADLVLDPDLTPRSFLPWLASWVGMSLDGVQDERDQRRLVRRAAELARWRGTRHGMKEELRLRTGGRALIVENFDGMRLGQDASLGLNTRLGTPRAGFVAVTLVDGSGQCPPAESIEELVGQIEPAYVDHAVYVVPSPAARPGPASEGGKSLG